MFVIGVCFAMRLVGALVALVAVAFSAALPRAARAEDVGGVRPTFEGLERGPDTGETYRLNALQIVSHEVSGVFPTLFVSPSKWWRPVRGKFRWATSYDDFYRKLGRPDLAAAHARRQVLSSTLFWGGLAAEVGGAVLFFTGLGDGFSTRAKIGLGLFGGGLVVSTVGSVIQPPLVSEEDALRMANAYNRLLEQHLGLEGGVVGAAGARRRTLGMTFRARW
jgi:hypothetical protein